MRGIRKYRVGDFVKVRTTINVGQSYRNKDGSFDYFYEGMSGFKGQVGQVTHVTDDGYRLDIDLGIWNYTEEMLVTIVDVFAKENRICKELEDTVILVEMQSHLDMYMKLIDESLKNGDKEKFLEYSSLYNKLKDSFTVLYNMQ